MSGSTRRSERIAAVLLATGRAASGLVPRRLRKVFENRFFYAVFNLTRVTNDNYGWRPETDPADAAEPDAAGQAEEP